jgi:hypothetical protein
MIEYEPKTWDNTNAIIRMGGKHYSTLMKNNTHALYRKFVIHLSEEELVVAKLTLGNEVSIDSVPDHEVYYLKASGYMK